MTSQPDPDAAASALVAVPRFPLSVVAGVAPTPGALRSALQGWAGRLNVWLCPDKYLEFTPRRRG
jgi:hypothetical protein